MSTTAKFLVILLVLSAAGIGASIYWSSPLLAAGSGAVFLGSLMAWRAHGRQVEKLKGEIGRLEERLQELSVSLDEERLDLEERRREAREQELRLFRELTHGLRIPISIILGYADILMGDYVADEQVAKEYLEKISEQIVYINELLGQMLMEVRNNAQVPSLVLEPLDILNLVKRVAEDMTNVFASRGIVVRVSSAQEQVVIQGDATQMHKVFHNILENSLKYMGREGTVNIICAYSGEDEALIVVKDDGRGLPAEETERIFELNYQGSNKASGYGMGLHLVREAIRAHGGTVTAKSDIGKGMAFYITLPVQRQLSTAIAYTKPQA